MDVSGLFQGVQDESDGQELKSIEGREFAEKVMVVSARQLVKSKVVRWLVLQFSVARAEQPFMFSEVRLLPMQLRFVNARQLLALSVTRLAFHV